MFAGGRKPTFISAAALRKNQTHAEQVLWDCLRKKPLGFKFRRQHVYALWVLDFYCHALKLAIEVDGSIHNVEDVKKADERRQKEIEMTGLTFLRFTNEQVEHNLDEVKRAIENSLLSDCSKIVKPDEPKSLRQLAEDKRNAA